jgi:hypothetical protein
MDKCCDFCLLRYVGMIYVLARIRDCGGEESRSHSSRRMGARASPLRSPASTLRIPRFGLPTMNAAFQL